MTEITCSVCGRDFLPALISPCLACFQDVCFNCTLFDSQQQPFCKNCRGPCYKCTELGEDSCCNCGVGFCGRHACEEKRCFPLVAPDPYDASSAFKALPSAFKTCPNRICTNCHSSGVIRCPAHRKKCDGCAGEFLPSTLVTCAECPRSYCKVCIQNKDEKAALVFNGHIAYKVIEIRGKRMRVATPESQQRALEASATERIEWKEWMLSDSVDGKKRCWEHMQLCWFCHQNTIHYINLDPSFGSCNRACVKCAGPVLAALETWTHCIEENTDVNVPRDVQRKIALYLFNPKELNSSLWQRACFVYMRCRVICEDPVDKEPDCADSQVHTKHQS